MRQLWRLDLVDKARQPRRHAQKLSLWSACHYHHGSSVCLAGTVAERARKGCRGRFDDGLGRKGRRLVSFALGASRCRVGLSCVRTAAMTLERTPACTRQGFPCRIEGIAFAAALPSHHHATRGELLLNSSPALVWCAVTKHGAAQGPPKHLDGITFFFAHAPPTGRQVRLRSHDA